jgi:hypothetical protein
MIQLEAKQAVSAQAAPPEMLSSLQLVPLSVVVAPGGKPVVLCQDNEITKRIEESGDLSVFLAAKMPFEKAGWRILIHSVTAYQPDRFLYNCLAVRVNNSGK